MITKERLEELIEQGSKIFYFDAYGDDEWGIVEVDTKNFSFSHNENCYTNFCEETYRTNPQPYKMYEDSLFETKEEAEWHKEFGCIFRIETLELPTWEEFVESDNWYIKFISKKGNRCMIQRCYDDKTNNGFLYVMANGENLLEKGYYTKENYYEACKLAKELFLGEKK